jgi:DNA-binding transcriptional LysR family regulator
MTGVELRQLVYFDAVVRHGGFTRASGRLHIAQSALSAQISRLEKELGVSLLIRGTRHVALTPAGELFLDRTRRVLGELDAARADLADLTSAIRGQVTLGVTHILGPIDLPTTLARFHAEHPGIAVTLRSGLIAELLDRLDSGDVDLLLGPIHDDLPSRYSAQPMFLEQVLLVTPPGHRLRHRPEVTLAEVRDEPFVCLRPGSGLRAILTAAATAAGFQPHVPFETDSPRGVRELVSAELGVAVLARSAVDAPGPPVHSHHLQPSPPHPPFGLVHHRDHRLTPTAQTCRLHVLRFAALNRPDPRPAVGTNGPAGRDGGAAPPIGR